MRVNKIIFLPYLPHELCNRVAQLNSRKKRKSGNEKANSDMKKKRKKVREES